MESRGYIVIVIVLIMTLKCSQEEGWAVCRVFKKRTPTTMRRMSGHESPCWYDDQVSFMSDLDSPQQVSQSNNVLNYASHTLKKELNHHHLPFQIPQEHLIHLPLFENSKMLLASPHGTGSYNNTGLVPYGIDMSLHSNATMQQIDNSHNATILIGNNNNNNNNNDQDVMDQVTDWRVLDKFVASQLSHEDVTKGHNSNSNNNYSSSGVASGIFPAAPISDHSNKEDSLPDKSSTPTSSSQIDVWK